MPLTRPEPTPSRADEPAVFHPDPELSEQISRLTERALTRVAVDGAVQSARSRVSALEQEVARLRAEAQWREAGWSEERAELQALAHSAQLDTAEQRSRLKQSLLDVMELEDEARCARTVLDETRIALATMAAQHDTQRERLQSSEEEVERLRDQLLERERILGAMWQTLQEYRAQGPLHRLLRRPGLPDAKAPLLLGAVDAETTA